MVKPKRNVFISTTLITTLIFLVGLAVGYTLDNFRSEDILVNLQTNELDTQSYLIEQDFFDAFGGYNCSLVQPRLKQISEELGELGYYVLSYDKKSIFKEKDYDYLLRKYFLSEIKAYLLFNELKQNCELDNNLVLYFFEIDDPQSELQGNVLDALVKKNRKTIVFSINKDYTGDPMIETIKAHYGVKQAPTIILNNDIVKEGFVGKEELQKLFNQEPSP